MPSGTTKSRPAPAGEISVRTERRTQLLDVTAAVAKLVKDAAVQSGVCYLYVPHTTAGVLINENADPDVATDIEAALARLIPPGPPAHADFARVGEKKDAIYKHAEGNADAHIKASLVGTSATIFISDARLELGRWQGIFFCEFDGPRTRRLRVKIVPD
jgi:secondary thiamine-phosphate synthase enzyme